MMVGSRVLILTWDEKDTLRFSGYTQTGSLSRYKYDRIN